MMYIDSREPKKIVVAARRLGDVKVILMEAGDFENFKHTILIERKTPADVWGRVFNRTWHIQMQKLQEHSLQRGTMPWLILEGSFEEYHLRTKGKMPIEQCKQAVASAAIRYGLNVWTTEDVDHTVKVAFMLCKHADKGKLCSPKVIPFMRGIKDSRVGVIMNLFHISQRQSISLLKRHGNIVTILRVLSKDPNKLTSVDYMGPGTVKKMKRLMETKFK